MSIFFKMFKETLSVKEYSDGFRQNSNRKFADFLELWQACFTTSEKNLLHMGYAQN